MIELPQIPPPLHLTSRAVELLTQLCFRQNDESMPSPDLLFIFGTSLSVPELAKSLQGLIREKSPRLLLITGGVTIDDIQMKESEAIYEAIQNAIPSSVEVLLEKESRNTYENVAFGLKKITPSVKSVCFVAKSYHAGRAYLTLRHFLKEAMIYQASYPARDLSSDYPITACNWPCKPEFVQRVWGEFLRIKTYGTKGNLALDEVLEMLAELEIECQ